MINIISVTRCGDDIVGMRVGYDEDEYRHIFSYGDTEEDVKNKAARIYIETNMDRLRKRYKK